jgi:hypothetical protein
MSWTQQTYPAEIFSEGPIGLKLLGAKYENTFIGYFIFMLLNIHYLAFIVTEGPIGLKLLGATYKNTFIRYFIFILFNIHYLAFIVTLTFSFSLPFFPDFHPVNFSRQHDDDKDKWLLEKENKRWQELPLEKLLVRKTLSDISRQ